MAKEFDLHGHTKEVSWFEFVNYDVCDAIDQAQAIDLDGIAITQHWSLKGVDKALDYAEGKGIIVVPGVELSTRVGIVQAPHVIALGITPENVYGNNEKLPFLWCVEDTIQWIHDHGGVAIAAHPMKQREHIALSHKQVITQGTKFDGIETTTPFGTNLEMTTHAVEHKIAQIGSSDFHMLSQIGLVGTKVPDTVKSWQEVVEAVRNNQTQAFIRTNIPPELQGTRGFSILLKQIKGDHV